MFRKTILGAAVASALLGATGFAEEPPAPPASKPEVKVKAPKEAGAPARIETTVGTFEVNPKNVDLLRRALAGEPVETPLYAGGD